MKPAVCWLVGAVLGLAGGAVLSVVFNGWYTGAHVRSDDDANVLVVVTVFVLLLSSLTGAWLAHRVHRREKGPADRI